MKMKGQIVDQLIDGLAYFLLLVFCLYRFFNKLRIQFQMAVKYVYRMLNVRNFDNLIKS